MTTIVIENGIIYTDNQTTNVADTITKEQLKEFIDSFSVRYPQYIKTMNRIRNNKLYDQDKEQMKPIKGKFRDLTNTKLGMKGVGYAGNMMVAIMLELYIEDGYTDIKNFPRYLEENFNGYTYASLTHVFESFMPEMSESLDTVTMSSIIGSYIAFVDYNNNVHLVHPVDVKDWTKGYTISQYGSERITFGSGPIAVDNTNLINLLSDINDDNWYAFFHQDTLGLSCEDWISECSFNDPYTNSDVRILNTNK